MKKTLAILTALVTAGSVFAQGTITFFGLAPIKMPDGRNVASTDNITAGLFLSTDLNNPIGTTTFIEGGNFGLLNAVNVTVPGHAVQDASALYVVRAWETSAGSYANAVAQGKLNGTTITPFTSGKLGGKNPVEGELPFTPPDLGNNYVGFTLVPEPSTIALGVIGIGALFLRRRK